MTCRHSQNIFQFWTAGWTPWEAGPFLMKTILNSVNLWIFSSQMRVHYAESLKMMLHLLNNAKIIFGYCWRFLLDLSEYHSWGRKHLTSVMGGNSENRTYCQKIPIFCLIWNEYVLGTAPVTVSQSLYQKKMILAFWKHWDHLIKAFIIFFPDEKSLCT